MAAEKIIPDIGPVPRFEKYPLELSDWRDGIVVRSPNWLGDAVMSLPALAVLRRTVPHPCGLFVVCPRGLAPLFRMLPEIVDTVIDHCRDDTVLPMYRIHGFPLLQFYDYR